MSSFKFKLKKIDETRNYLLNDLLKEKYKKVQKSKYLNYVKSLLISASTVTGSVSISAVASLICVPFGISSSAVGINILHSLQELKSINQLSTKRKKSMIKWYC